jgi:hypothetical protein
VSATGNEVPSQGGGTAAESGPDTNYVWDFGWIKILGGGPDSPGQAEGALQATELVLTGLGLRALARALVGRIFGKGAVELSKKTIRKEIQLYGGRSGQRVPSLKGPPNSIVRGGGERVFVTDAQGRVVSDITRNRVKSVIPGQGFGPKRPPTAEELKILEQFGY